MWNQSGNYGWRTLFVICSLCQMVKDKQMWNINWHKNHVVSRPEWALMCVFVTFCWCLFTNIPKLEAMWLNLFSFMFRPYYIANINDSPLLITFRWMERVEKKKSNNSNNDVRKLGNQLDATKWRKMSGGVVIWSKVNRTIKSIGKCFILLPHHRANVAVFCQPKLPTINHLW